MRQALDLTFDYSALLRKRVNLRAPLRQPRVELCAERFLTREHVGDHRRDSGRQRW